jgi:hypothetical protein
MVEVAKRKERSRARLGGGRNLNIGGQSKRQKRWEATLEAGLEQKKLGEGTLSSRAVK